MSAYRIYATRLSDDCIAGPFAVYAIRESDNRVVSACTGIRSAAACEQRALDYHFSFGRAPIQYAASVVGAGHAQVQS